MVLMASSAEARRSRRQHVLPNGTTYWRSAFIHNPPQLAAPSPNAFLVEQAPDSVILPHFHQANQFQVVVAGGGRLGKHAVGRITAHYANAYTPYGPIHAGAEGLHYFTLRDDFDPGARFMPGARADLKPVRRRHALGEPLTPMTEDALAATAGIEQIAVLDPEPDGLGAWNYRVPPGTSTRGPDPHQGGGQYHVVVAGALRYGDVLLPPLSCLFISGAEAPLALSAGPRGLELLVLQFPRKTNN